MADINFSSLNRSATADSSEGAPSHEPICDIHELLFFAYRDFVSDPDDVLTRLNFGRAHHRVLHFVNRHPGMMVADLLDVLKITKQSLGRVLKQLVDRGTPTFGICLGHQMLGIALGGRTMKMHQGHHGANHPVKDMTTGKVEITSMNHGFAVDKDSLPKNVEQTHVSLFDGSNCGIALKDRPVFSVQYHPEASPGPRDSHYLFTRFVELMRARKARAA